MTAAPAPLAAIVIACLAGGVLAIIAAAGTLALHSRWISRLVSFAVGALLGAVFLELLPHALGAAMLNHDGTERVMVTVLAGLLLFFLLEKLVLWRHSHDDAETLDGSPPTVTPQFAHDTDRGRSGLMIVIGNSVHNFCDGIVIAATFITDFALGTTTALAIVAHAIPQQVGDFAVLMHSGYTRRRAFAYNLATGAATLAGGLAGYAAIASMQQILPTVLALAAASLLYVAVADLIPSLHRHPAPAQTALQLVLIGVGIAIIALAHVALEH
jgi:zinc and cadmium transporter